MRDLVFIAFLGLIFAAGFRRPFIFVLAYVYIDIVSPQRLTYVLLNAVPISMIAVGLAIVSWLAIDPKRDSRLAPRQGLILILLLYCWYSTLHADFPVDAAFKWEWVWKALAFAIFLPLTLRTKLRIEALLLFMILSAASIIIDGGIKTVGSGGGYGQLNLMVENNSGLYEGSTISMVAIAIIPIIVWFTRFGSIFAPDWRVKTFSYALIFACLQIPVGTSTRTGLLCIALLGLLMLRDTKRRLTYIALAGVLALAAIPFLPSAFTERMETIKTYKADTSASTRLEVWKWTIAYAKDHPFGGGFEAYRQNKIRYDTVKVEGAANNATLDKTLGGRFGPRLPQRLFRDAWRAGLSRPRDLAADSDRRTVPDGGRAPPLCQGHRRPGLGQSARRGAAERAFCLSAGGGLHRHRVPAVRLYVDRRADRTRHLSGAQA